MHHKRSRPTLYRKPKPRQVTQERSISHKWLEKVILDPSEWTPFSWRAMEVVSRETFDFAEKLLVIVAFGAAAKVLRLSTLDLFVEVLSLFLIIYFVTRADRGLGRLLKRAGIPLALAAVTYLAASVAVIALCYFVIFPTTSDLSEVLIAFASK